MRNTNERQRKVDQAKGRVKQAVGTLTGDKNLKAEGLVDETVAKVEAAVGRTGKKIGAAIATVAETVTEQKPSAVFGIYSTHTALQSAVDALRAKGFRSSDISVLSANHPAFADVAPIDHPTPSASAGPSTASAVGATLGWLVGISALAMAGGVFIVAGPVMLALARMGEAAGDIGGALTGFGMPNAAAEEYEGRIVAGGMLLSVHTEDSGDFTHGRQILEETGATAITAVSEPARRVVLPQGQRLM